MKIRLIILRTRYQLEAVAKHYATKNGYDFYRKPRVLQTNSETIYLTTKYEMEQMPEKYKGASLDSIELVSLDRLDLPIEAYEYLTPQLASKNGKLTDRFDYAILKGEKAPPANRNKRTSIIY